MKDITVIIPVHTIDNKIIDMLENALQSVDKNRINYQNIGNVFTKIVCPKNIVDEINNSLKEKHDFDIIVNNGDTDFCSQINYAVENIETDYFSILEFDDMYTEKWFKMVSDYYFTQENTSLFLPITILSDANANVQFCNEIAWSSSFSKEIGFIDNDCLQDFYNFNITGGVFNTKDFKSIGMFKPSIKVAFAYELLLRMTEKQLKVFVVPKEGYIHGILRENSLTELYLKEMTKEEIDKWFLLAKNEYKYDIDRKTTISDFQN